MAKAKPQTKPHAKTQTQAKKGAIYTFGGEYYCRQDKGLSVKAYELSVVFPELLQAPLSVFKRGVSETNHPIRNLMIKKYPDFTTVRTYNVIKVENYTNSKPKKTDDISVMDIEQLKHYISENDLGIDTAVYDNAVDKVRGAITLAETDPEKFEESYAEAVKNYEYKKELESLNGNDLDGDDNNESEDEGKDAADDLLDDLDGDDNGDDE